MITAFPRRTRVYKNHHLDSTRWDHVPLRDDDVVISTSLKTGTTWTQRILSLLVLGPGPLSSSLNFVSPWIDAVFWAPVEIVRDLVEAQEHRRFFKCHLPLDALPYSEKVKYIYVGRDGRDVFMSLWNHYGAYNDAIYGQLNDPSKLVGEPLARCPEDIHTLFAESVSRGSFPWEHDGFPFWSHFYHAQSFWNFRHLPNIHFVHFNDLKADLEKEMRRIAASSTSRWRGRVAGDRRRRDLRSDEARRRLRCCPSSRPDSSAAPRPSSTKARTTAGVTCSPPRSSPVRRMVAKTVTADCARWLEQGAKAGNPKTLVIRRRGPLTRHDDCGQTPLLGGADPHHHGARSVLRLVRRRRLQT